MPPSSAGAILGSPFLTCRESHQKLVVLLLNYKLPDITPAVWKQAQLRICADGGANRLYDAAPSWIANQEADAARLAFVPQVIKGDLDSIRPEVAKFYSNLGTKIVDLSNDQDSTDLHKCLHCAEQRLLKQGIPFSETTILALGALGGRLDHSLTNINTLYSHQHLQLVLCGDGSLARLLPKGRSIIRPHSDVEGPMCGVIALGEAAIVSSTGLKWNLDNHRLSVGGLMSSSNAIVSETVEITSDKPLLWTTEFKDIADGMSSS